jgi:hypothetical protein
MDLTTKTLSEMLAESSDHEDALEAEYRRGYADAIGALFQQSDAMPLSITRSDLEASLWRWWGKLLLWEQSNALQAPPFEWRMSDAGVGDER